MNIELTPQQLRALDAGEGGLTRFIDPRSNVSYVLVSEAEYETVREVVEDEKRQRTIHAIALKNAAGQEENST